MNTKLVKWSKLLQSPVLQPGYLHSLSNFLEFRERTRSKMYGGASVYSVLAVLITDSPVLCSHCSCLSSVSALAAMELGEVREKALSYQSVLR